MKNWIAATMTTIATLCTLTAAHASTVRFDADETMDTTAWTSFAFRSPEAPNGGSLAERRIREALDAGFAAKGYAPAERGEADFLIDYRAGARRDLRLNESFSRGFGRDLRLDSVAVGTLLVDVYEAKSGKLYWRGTVSDALATNPEKKDEKTAKAVEKLLKKFPSREVP